MKRAFENSCIKGCAIYFAVLVIILVASAVGFGGLSARFGMSSPAVQGSPQSSAQGAQNAPAPQATAANSAQAETDAQAQQQSQPSRPSGSTGGPIIVINPPQQEQVPTPTFTPTAVPAAAPPPAPVQSSAPPAQGSYAPPVQSQGGEIKGQASQPFYIVQSNDTLSGIASRFSTTVEALRQANSLQDVNSIWPGQLLYLPQGGQAPSGPQGETGGGTATQGGPGPIPSMPNTGINSGR